MCFKIVIKKVCGYHTNCNVQSQIHFTNFIITHLRKKIHKLDTNPSITFILQICLYELNTRRSSFTVYL